MVKDVCVNGTMVNTNNYSSPVPLVGLYIAAAGTVCFFLVLLDVWSGFRNKKYWFPCRFFSINSITLTLISIAAKIPVDLTTEMPSKQDQLSKLCGTVFICVSMCFMVPSIAINAEFESYANVTALSIFVVTVVVNICIQLATGVIFSFIAEHVIIMIFMLSLLLRFWISVANMNALKSENADIGTELIKNGEGNMLERLKLCYIYSYHSCLQLTACSSLDIGDVGLVCIMCSTILVQATLKSLAPKDLRFCEGVSDYGWSMWLVVVSQILTVSVINFAIGGRVLMNVAHLLKTTTSKMQNRAYLQFQYLFSLRNIPIFMEKIFRFVVYLPLFYFHVFFVVPSMIVDVLLAIMVEIYKYYCGNIENGLDNKCEAFREQLSSHQVAVVDWVLKKGVADLMRCMEMNDAVSLNHLTCLLSTVLPSRQSSAFYVGLNGEGIKVSLLSLVLLVEIDKAVIKPPTTQDKNLIKTLDEVFEMVHFIENEVNIGSSEDRLRFTVGKVIQKYGLTGGIAEFILEQNWDRDNCKVNFIFVQKPLCGICPVRDSVTICVRKAGSEVNDIINYRIDEPSEAVHGRIEKIFVDMLHAYLAQLPGALFAHIQESPIEEYQERVRLGLGFMSKLQAIQSHVRFVLPSGTSITSLFNNQTTSTNMPAQCSTQMHVLSILTHPTVEDVGEIQEHVQGSEEQV